MLDTEPDRGIYPKYLVFRWPDNADDNVLHQDWRWGSLGPPLDDFVFVLKPISDKHARIALAAYAESVKEEKPKLAFDIRMVLSDF